MVEPREPEPRIVPPLAVGPVPAMHPGTNRPLLIGFFLVTGLVLALLLAIYRSFLHPVLWAAALATLVYPGHRRLRDRLGGRANLSAVISTLLLLLVVLGPSAAVLNALLNEARDLWPKITDALGTDLTARFSSWAEVSPFARFIHLVLQVPTDLGATGIEDRLQALIEGLSAAIMQWLRDVTIGAPGALFQAFLTPVIFFFFLREGPHWGRQLREALPLERAHAEALLATAANTVQAVFRGVLLTALAQAVLATIGFVMVGAPVPILLGFATLVGSLLPFAGAATVWGLTAIGLFIAGRTGAAIGLAIWGVLVVSLIDNILKPVLIGRGSQLPMLWLFLAILGGLKTFGMLGLLVGPAALALFIACWRIYAQRRPHEIATLETPPGR